MILHVATYNLWHAHRLDRAIEVMRHEPDLAGSDLLALQEVDEAGAERIAGALGMHDVSYHGELHPRTRRRFGPALLSRWPLANRRRVLLPHRGIHGLRRVAVAATATVRGVPVEAWAVHFGTMREILPAQQAAQVEHVLEQMEPGAGDGGWEVGGPTVVAGDLNRKGLGRLFTRHGFRWLTRDVGLTHHIWSFDHVFVRDCAEPRWRVGSVKAALTASDHRAVWAEIRSPSLARPAA